MGCLPELLEPDAGCLFETGNQQSLHSTMKRVISEDFVQKGINAFKRASDATKSQFIIQTIRAYNADKN